jgi:YegS/Rv2252/BmrU family lipid kinase
MSLINIIEKPLFIVNPESNERRALKKWKQIEYSLGNYLDYDIIYTTTKKETIDSIKKDRVHRKIITVGGDGTVNAVLEGLLQSDSEKILGIIPAGIANDISRTFNICSNLNEFYHILSNENTKETDVGEVNGNYFLGYASLGFDAATLKERNKRRFLKGKLAYFTGALRALFSYTSKTMKIKIGKNDGVSKNIFLMVISNIKHYASGMEMAPDAKPDDGLLDLCVIEGESNLGTILNNLPPAYSGKHIGNPEVDYSQVEQLEVISPEPVLLQVDGELVGEDNHFKFNLANKRIKMLVR